MDELIKEYAAQYRAEMCYVHLATNMCKELYSGKDPKEIINNLRDHLDACHAGAEIIFREMEKHVNNSAYKKI